MNIKSKKRIMLDKYNMTYTTQLNIGEKSINEFLEFVRIYKTNNMIDKTRIDIFLGEYYNMKLESKKIIFINNIIYVLFVNYLIKHNITLKNNAKNLILKIK